MDPATDRDGLRLAATSCLMVDKLTTVPRARLRRRIGILDDAHLVRMNRSILVFLGLAR